ncbi:MAG TPA: hypothetical protein ENN32_04195 [Chloroflexi bacterium]|nr:hypothetical protein [Chloroflexota bacterium]
MGMQFVAVLNHESPALYQRWLRDNLPTNLITLVSPKHERTIQEIHSGTNLTITTIVVPTRPTDPRIEEIKAELGIPPDTTITLPAFFKEDPAKFIERGTFPKIQDDYNGFRLLWHFGFRHFETYNFQGTRAYHVPHLLDEFVDIHKNQRAFIVGNGPSLNQIDMSKLASEITYGSNRSYLGYDKWQYHFTYWGIVDRLQIEHYQFEYEDNVPVEIVKFFPFQYLPLFNFDNACPVPHKFGTKPGQPQFSLSPDMLYLGWSVSFFLIQIAAIMGCNPIILVGMDHNYSLDQRKMGMIDGNRWYDRNTFTRKLINRMQRLNQKPNKPHTPQMWKASDASGATHFDERYTQGEDKLFVPPRPVYAEQAYAHARKVTETHGIQILNATPGSKLTEFEPVDFNSLF